MLIFGGDISMNGSGLVKLNLDDDLNILDMDYLAFTKTIYISKKSKGKILLYPDNFKNYIEKNRWFHNHIVDFVSGCEYGAIEHYAYAAKGKVFDIAEFGGLLKYLLYERGIKIRLYAPTVVKKYATSYGGDGKTLVVDAYDKIIGNKFDLDYLLDDGKNAKRKIDPRYESPRADIIDGYWLAQTLLTELRLRKGVLRLRDLDEKKIEIFNEVSKVSKTNVLATEFLHKS